MTENELKILQNYPLSLKIEKTKLRIMEWVNHYGEENVYISFSGGKDSTVLLDIARSMYPNMQAVFSNTGLEFPEIVQFVKTFDNVEVVRPGMCDLSYMSSITRRGRVQEGGKVSPAVTTAAHNICYVDQYRIRKITPLEAWRLMGFSDSDYNKAAEVCSNTQLYKQAGNSIVVNVMEAIFKNIYDK